MSVQQIKSQIKRLAKEFDLNYNPKRFKHLWIPVRYEILTEYLGTCPDPIYQKYGKTARQRTKAIDKFVNSKDFRICLKRYGGQVVQKKALKQEEKWIKQIEDKKLRTELLKFHQKIKNKLGKSDFLALMTIPRNEKEKDWQMRFCLRHEWLHIFLIKNRINFQNKENKYWEYDEGLVTYMEGFLDNTLNILEVRARKREYPMEKQYYIYAAKLRELLKDKKTPKERKKAILKLINKLKKG